MSSDVSGHIRDKPRPMPKHSFTSTETRRLVRTGSPGRSPRLSYSSRTMIERYVASTVLIEYPSISEGAGSVGGQLRGDKECPFSGVTKSGTVWRKVPESDEHSEGVILADRISSIPGCIPGQPEELHIECTASITSPALSRPQLSRYGLFKKERG